MLLHIIYHYFILLYAYAYKMNIIAEFVKSKRKQLGLTQEDLAESAGVAFTVVRNIEQGRDNVLLFQSE